MRSFPFFTFAVSFLSSLISISFIWITFFCSLVSCWVRSFSITRRSIFCFSWLIRSSSCLFSFTFFSLSILWSRVCRSMSLTCARNSASFFSPEVKRFSLSEIWSSACCKSFFKWSFCFCSLISSFFLRNTSSRNCADMDWASEFSLSSRMKFSSATFNFSRKTITSSISWSFVFPSELRALVKSRSSSICPAVVNFPDSIRSVKFTISRLSCWMVSRARFSLSWAPSTRRHAFSNSAFNCSIVAWSSWLTNEF